MAVASMLGYSLRQARIIGDRVFQFDLGGNQVMCDRKTAFKNIEYSIIYGYKLRVLNSKHELM